MFKVGQVCKTNHWGDVEIINADKQQSLTVRFVNTGNIKRRVRATELRAGTCRDDVAHKAGVPMQNFVSPQRVAAMMYPGELYKSNLWGDMEVIEYISSREVRVRFIDSGNEVVVQRDAILRGLVKDVERSKLIHSITPFVLKTASGSAKVFEAYFEGLVQKERQIRRHESEARSNGMTRWYKILRDFRCSFDSEGKLLAGEVFVDRNGFEYQVVGKKKFDQLSWFVSYLQSGNTYLVTEDACKSGQMYDKLDEDSVLAEKFRLKLVNSEKYEQDRERRIKMAAEYQRNNVERTRVRNRNRRALRMNAKGSHTLEEVLDLFDRQDGKCKCCGIQLTEETRELDHDMPLILGGSNSIENLQWYCQFCNSCKSATHPVEWAVYSQSEEFKQRRLARLSTAAECSTQI